MAASAPRSGPRVRRTADRHARRHGLRARRPHRHRHRHVGEGGGRWQDRAMANLIYSAITSLDGFTADSNGNFDWAAPDEEVHAFVNDQERPVGTYLYGRRMYETMVYWETASTGDDQPAVVRDYARIWQAADKVVYSSTLDDGLQRADRARAEVRPGRRPPAEERPRSGTSPSEVRGSRRTRSRPAWWTSATSSSTPSWWAGGRTRCPPVSTSSWSCWTSAGSAMAWSTCDTGSARPRGPGEAVAVPRDDLGPPVDAETGSRWVHAPATSGAQRCRVGCAPAQHGRMAARLSRTTGVGSGTETDANPAQVDLP